MKKEIIPEGSKFHRWTVLPTGHSGRSLHCVCECGTKKLVCKSNLKNGKSKSCGCLSVELTKEREKTHGMHGSREYYAWYSLRQRCKGNGSHGFYYKERNISYDPHWEKFENFYEDMGNCPDGLSLDRINNNLGYSKDNCQWADCSQQASNRRKNTKNTSGRIGVNWDKEKCKWRVAFKVRGVRIHVGYFLSYQAACQACEEAELLRLGYSRKDY